MPTDVAVTHRVMDKGGPMSTSTDIVALAQRHFLSSLAVSHPIHNLPVELLERIFIHCIVRQRSVGFDALLNHPHSPKWIGITHVCHLWREIALRCPHLWTHIATDLSPAWIAAFASCSSSKPLIVEINVNHIANGTFHKHLSTNISRLKELYLGCEFDEAIDVDETLFNLGRTLSTPAPLLENLVLDFQDITLGGDLFAGCTPQLRRLWLGRGISISPTSSLLPNLRDLKMHSVSSFRETLTVLQRTPLLENLYIGYFDEEPAVQMVGFNINGSSIQLPHLSHLFIKPNSFITLLCLVALLKVPPTLHLGISFDIDNMTIGHQRSTEWIHMLGVIGGHLRANASKISAPLTELNLNIFRHDLTFACRPNSGSAPHPLTSQHLLEEIDDTWYWRECNHDCRSPFFFRYGFQGDVDSPLLPMYHVQSMCNRMPLANIRALNLCIDLLLEEPFRDPSIEECRIQGCDPRTWLPILRLMPEVCVLKVSKDAVIGVLKALTPDVNADNGLEAPLFVHLTALIIKETYVGHPDHSGDDHQGQVLLETLKAFVTHRKEVGLELESILLRDCECIEGIVDLLRGYVKDVSWVGRNFRTPVIS